MRQRLLSQNLKNAAARRPAGGRGRGRRGRQRARGGARRRPRRAMAEVRAFYREVARSLPALVHKFWLNDFVSVPTLRTTVCGLFKQHKDVKDPELVKLLMHKGKLEFNMIKKRHKQRHHLLRDYVHNVRTETVEKVPTDKSAFLNAFNANKL